MLPISCRALAEPPIRFPLKTKGGLGQSVQAPWDVGNCDADGGRGPGLRFQGAHSGVCPTGPRHIFRGGRSFTITPLVLQPQCLCPQPWIRALPRPPPTSLSWACSGPGLLGPRGLLAMQGPVAAWMQLRVQLRVITLSASPSAPLDRSPQGRWACVPITAPPRAGPVPEAEAALGRGRGTGNAREVVCSETRFLDSRTW